MKLVKLVSSDLGAGMVFVPQRKEWIGAVLSTVGGVASSLFGGLSAAAAAREAEHKQKAQEAKDEAYYLRRYNEDYADTAAGQNIVRRALDHFKAQRKADAGTKAVMGSTDAHSQMAKDMANREVANMLGNMAATDQLNKTRIDEQHQASQRHYAQLDANREMQRAQNITNAASAASNALMSIGNAVDQAGTRNVNVSGGSNNSTPVVKDNSVNMLNKEAPTTSAAINVPTLSNVSPGATEDELLRAKKAIGGY